MNSLPFSAAEMLPLKLPQREGEVSVPVFQGGESPAMGLLSRDYRHIHPDATSVAVKVRTTESSLSAMVNGTGLYETGQFSLL